MVYSSTHEKKCIRFYYIMNLREAIELIGVAQNDTLAKTKTKYKKLLLNSHPDKGGSPEMVQAVVAAYNLLEAAFDARNKGWNNFPTRWPAVRNQPASTAYTPLPHPGLGRAHSRWARQH
jgi:curved DNA-binding protein CbpA